MKKKQSSMKYLFLLGRVLFALIFIIKPLDHFSNALIHHADQMGVPLSNFFVPLWGVLALLGGLSVLLGFKPKVGAWLIVIFLFPTTFYMHPFWMSESFFSNMMQSYCFWKNISMMGAALMITYMGSGPYSVDKA